MSSKISGQEQESPLWLFNTAEINPQDRILDLAKLPVTTSLRNKLSHSIQKDLDQYERIIRAGYRQFQDTSELLLTLSPAAEWMLDNFVIVEQSLRLFRENLPYRYETQLPRFTKRPFSGDARILHLAYFILRSSAFLIDEQQIKQYVNQFQTVQPLTTGELWALPSLLRYGLLMVLAHAITLAVKLAPPPAAPDNFDNFTQGITLSPDELVSRIIPGLRQLSAIDWQLFFEETSQVEKILSDDPADAYAKMDFSGRDLYRQSLEKFAKYSRFNEIEISNLILTHCRKHAQDLKNLQEPSDKVKALMRRKTHVGYYLAAEGQDDLAKEIGYHPPFAERFRVWGTHHATWTYLLPIFLLTITALLGIYAVLPANLGALKIGLYLFAAGIPCLSIAIGVVNFLISKIFHPYQLPKMDYAKGIPDEFTSAVIIPALLESSTEIESAICQLEKHYLSNPDKNLRFVLLTDYTDAAEEAMPQDGRLLTEAKAKIETLNNKYGTVFFLFHRKRLWNAGEDCWMGWERKRGKLAQFNHYLLTHNETPYEIVVGNTSLLSCIRYVITLDADTDLPYHAANRLIGTLSHPLNQAVYDEEHRKVLAGYVILQPRVQLNPAFSNDTWFSRIFSEDTFFDLYSRAVSDVYMDLFHEGIFIGKGIYDVQAFSRCMHGRVLENTLLSHDLFEGIFSRVGLVSDILLYEDFPTTYFSYLNRQHRWIRGDWQLTPWLLPKIPNRFTGNVVNGLSLIGRWKIWDNLRRSILSPVLTGLLLLTWFFYPSLGLFSLILVCVTVFLPVLLSIFNQGLPSFLKSNQSFPISRSALALVMLASETSINLDAILSVLYRIYVSRKRLLQWVTSAHTIRLSRENPKHSLVWRRMIKTNWAVVGVFILLFLVQPQSVLPALPWIIVWLFAPQIAMMLGKTITVEEETLPPYATQTFRNIALRTWMFFETFVGPEDSWLPPDHFQESPKGSIAHRTSPTNIGLYLLSAITGYKFGYVTAIDLIYRVQQTLETLSKMDQYRGHLYNWYDTQSLLPLTPRYISTVDSGNLLAGLITLKSCFHNIGQEPIFQWQQFEGLLDCFSVIQEIIDDIPLEEEKQAAVYQISKISKEISEWRGQPETWICNLRDYIENYWESLEETIIALIEAHADIIDHEIINAIRVWMGRARYQMDNMLADFQYQAPWIVGSIDTLDQLRKMDSHESAVQDLIQSITNTITLPSNTQYTAMVPALQEIRDRVKNEISPRTSNRIRLVINEWDQMLEKNIQAHQRIASIQEHTLKMLDHILDQFIRNMDFSFLFHQERQVFHIGYNLETGQLDANYYDLLASESRIASYIAIATGNIPQSHWKHLARPITRTGNQVALLSWSATMFEYLMPSALMKTPAQSLMGVTIHTVIAQQIQYAEKHHVPWGISESGYYHFDAQQNYQYRAFGTPGLGLKRGLADDLVIAPYASLMCANEAPVKVYNNIQHLNQLHARGVYGYYEALDFTPERAPDPKGEIVRSYMAHHQGMVLIALCNALKDDFFINAFHSDSVMDSASLLLYENVGKDMPVDFPHNSNPNNQQPQRKRIPYDPWLPPLHSSPPVLHLLSNGKYHLAISNDGSGFARYGERDLTRWRQDGSLNQYGGWCFLFDHDKQSLWSIAEAPAPAEADFQEITFHPYKVEFNKRAFGIAASMDILVASDDDIEIRRVHLTNQSEQTRTITIASYAEIILSSQLDDLRHQAFNKLFIENHVEQDQQAIIYARRLRGGDEQPLYMAHAWYSESSFISNVSYITDRTTFIGRTYDIHNPQIFGDKKFLAKKQIIEENSLDPIASILITVEIPAHDSVSLYYFSTASAQKSSLIPVLQRYRSQSFIQRCFDGEKIKAEHNLQEINIEPRDIEFFDKFFSMILYPNYKYRAQEAILQKNQLGQSGLWPFGISGDLPICLIKINDLEQINVVSRILKGYIYWRSRSIKTDLVILNQRDTSYDQELNTLLQRLLSKLGATPWVGVKGGIYILRADQMPLHSRNVLETSANLILEPTEESIRDFVNNALKSSDYLPVFHASHPSVEEQLGVTPLKAIRQYNYNNEYGGFSEDGREYHIHIDRQHIPPAPWINVIANPDFGFVLSESGIGWSWAGNSGENRLTSWSNDPVLDQPGEALYLRDEETGQFWSPSFLPAGANTPYEVIHGAGYSIFRNTSFGISTELRYFVEKKDSIKFIQLKIRNLREEISRISTMYYADWVLGSMKNQGQLFIQQHFDTYLHAILARNAFHPDFSERVAFLASTRIPQAITSSRAEFLGRNGSFRSPAALQRVALSGQINSGYDPCAAMSHILWLSPGEEKEITYLLGQGKDEEDAKRLINKYQQFEQVEVSEARNKHFWAGLADSIQVHTPEPTFDLLINQWLLYQSVSSRFFGRSAFYQSSGAYGFRDQLQDSIAYLPTHPEWTRAFILNAAAKQFKEGDVLHWWHPPGDRGVRTRCSDDLLWLPYVVSEYLQATSDDNILDERIPFLEAPELQEKEQDRYDQFPQGSEQYSLLEHCLRAIQRGTTEGPHGLPLIGAHDWNDGFSRIGVRGKGESVWLGWFLSVVLERFAAILDQRNKSILSEEMLQTREKLIQNLLHQAWDGEWFLRAYFDDGTPLGSASNAECKIDAIAQSWAIFAGLQHHPYVKTALNAVEEQLIKRDDQLMLLFTPPFDTSLMDPGYIKGYQPGIRENGGQYTHAACWTIWAFAQSGQADKAFDLYQMINPIHHSNTREKADQYAVEPYVIAADVYNSPHHMGHGGWTWYTGSASWMYRLGLERILGLQIQKDGFSLDPAIPAAWDEYQIKLRLPKGDYDIVIKNPFHVNGSVETILLDGNPVRNKTIPWLPDRETHTVLIRLGED